MSGLVEVNDEPNTMGTKSNDSDLVMSDQQKQQHCDDSSSVRLLNRNDDQQTTNLLDDLTDDLKDAGWRKCYSNREKRYYYFNKFSRESIWNLKDLLHRDTIRDPLGIMTPVSSTSMQSPFSNYNSNRIIMDNLSVASSLTPQSDCSGFQPLSRRISSIDQDDYGLSSSPKRFASTKQNWNLRIDTNIITYERNMSLILPPNPDIELIKSELQLKYKKQFLNSLIECLNSICEAEPSTTATVDNEEIINNQFLETYNIYGLFLAEYLSQQQKQLQDNLIELYSTTTQTLFDDEFLLNSSLFKFLIRLITGRLNRKFNDIKTASVTNDTDYSVVKQTILNDCIDLYKSSIKRFNVTSVLNLFDKEITNWLKWCKYNDLSNDVLQPVDDTHFLDYLNSLKKKCESYVYDCLKLKLVKIFQDLNSISRNYKNEISNEYRLSYEEKNIKIFDVAPECRPNRRVLCYPILICTPSPLLPIPEYYHDRDDGFTYITYKSDKLSIKTDYFVKLEQLYKCNCKDDETKLNLFLARVWCLLKRYQVFYENDAVHANETATVQDEKFAEDLNLFNYYFYSLNSNVLDCLASLFYVTFEVYSNPLTSYFKQYCSLFDDTDGYFGSRGLFLNFKTIGGSLLALLPASSNIVNKYFKHITNLIENSNDPLSFIIAIPLVKIDKTLVDKITSNKFCKQYFKIPKGFVELRKFDEFKMSNRNDTIFKCDYEMLFAFVQNKEAEFKWPINEYDIDQLKYELQKDTINIIHYSP